MKEHLPEDLLQRSPSLLDVLKAGVRSLSRLGR